MIHDRDLTSISKTRAWFMCADRLQAYGVLGFARVRAGKTIQENSHMIEKQGGNNEYSRRDEA